MQYYWTDSRGVERVGEKGMIFQGKRRKGKEDVAIQFEKGRGKMGRTAFIFFVLVSLQMVYTVVTHKRGALVVINESKLTFTGFRSFVQDTRGNFIDPLVQMPDNLKVQQGQKHRRPFHVVVTADDHKYSKWQCRIMYYWYQKVKDHPDSEMGGFTRLLHSGRPDNLMDEIPSFVVDPLPPGEDMGYVVLNRPWAFVQWLERATIEEDYILMAEPDHILLRPMPNLATIDMPAAYPFFYIEPEKHEELLRKFFPLVKGPITNIDPIGNSPVIMKKSELAKIAPTWLNFSIAMKIDPDADEKFGWMLEMYGYATAAAWHGVKHILRKDFMVQPPFDTPELGDRFIIHYTYSCDFNMKGENTFWQGQIGEWRFDKRSFFEEGAPPRNLPLPPPGVPETVVILIKALNEAMANIPNWIAGE